ncbi:MAG: inositol monophosphatase [Fimbriimonadaceae bacterium]
MDLLGPLEDIVREAGRIASSARTGLVRETKADGSVVTNADREVETFLREALTKLMPETAVWGEEFGHDGLGRRGTWLVDPIDGTTNYAAGSPQWGVSVALVQNLDLNIGLVALPDYAEIWTATKGNGVAVNGVKINPIQPGPVQRHETVCYSESVARLNLKIPGKMRCSGAFVIEGTWVCRQWYRGLVGVRERLYDVAACILFAEELGADVRYLDGSPLDIATLIQGSRFEKPWAIFPSGSGFFAG